MLLTIADAVAFGFQALCVTLVGLFLVLVLIPPLHSPVRQLLRPLAIHHVESGLDLVYLAQRFQSPWLTYLFTKSSHSVSVTFYVRHSGCSALLRDAMAGRPTGQLESRPVGARLSDRLIDRRLPVTAGLVPADALLAGPSRAGAQPGDAGEQPLNCTTLRLLCLPVPLDCIALQTTLLNLPASHPDCR